MEPSVVEEVRLTSFKSFTDAVLPLEALTLVVGRNGSGKSNALDGLWTLTRLASGEDVSDALAGRRDGPALRGGAAGCAPFGESTFSLGCTVRTAEELVRLDVTVQVEPGVQIVAETLRAGDRLLLATVPTTTDSTDISAVWDDGQDGPHPHLTFRAGRLLASQVLARVPATTAGQHIHLAAAQVLTALRSVFVLDPVPHEMRQYVPRRDVVLRRTAGNLSAAVASLLEEPTTAARLKEAMSRLNEQDVVELTISRSDLDDVMLTMVERCAAQEHQVPARVMSDGSLRILAILVALLQAPTVDPAPEPPAPEDAVGQTTLMIEELENGLHASQAQLLVGLVRDEVHRRRVQALATANSPALLDALTGDEHGRAWSSVSGTGTAVARRGASSTCPTTSTSWRPAPWAEPPKTTACDPRPCLPGRRPTSSPRSSPARRDRDADAGRHLGALRAPAGAGKARPAPRRADVRAEVDRSCARGSGSSSGTPR